jgi:hypothetical protein
MFTLATPDAGQSGRRNPDPFELIRAKATTMWTSLTMAPAGVRHLQAGPRLGEYARAGKVPFRGWGDLADSTDPSVYARFLVRLNFPKDRGTFPQELEFLIEDFNYLASKVLRAMGPINGKLSGEPCSPSICFHEILSILARRRR